MNTVKGLSNLTQAALKLKVSRPTIYAMIKRGELHPIEISDRAYISQSDIDDFLARGTIPPTHHQTHQDRQGRRLGGWVVSFYQWVHKVLPRG